MIDHELTDPTGSALTITHNADGVWITATVDREEATVGPFPARALRASFDMGDDLLDGGVTAAAIEAEVDGRATWAKIRTHLLSPERARSLVQENTELRARIGQVGEARDLYRRDALTEERLHGEARRFALTWKETARRHILDAEAWSDQAYANGSQRDQARRRVEKAEQERDSVQAAMSRAIEENLRLRTENPRPEKYDAHAEAAEKVGALLQARTVDLVEAIADRDKARRELEHARKSLKESDAALHEMRETPRPLTADDITDEMVERGDDAWSGMDHFSARIPSAVVTTILRAALTEPAPEPTEAEKIAALVDAWHLDGHPRTTLPLYLASNGVRVTGEPND